MTPSLRRIRSLMMKEFLQLTRERVTLAMIAVMPFIQLLLFGFAINMDPRHLPVAVVAQDHSSIVAAITSSMQLTNYVDVRYLSSSEAEMEQLIRHGKVMMGVTIPPDFTRKLLKGEKAQLLAEADATDPTSAAGVLAAVAALPQQSLAQELTGPLARPQTPPPFEVVIHRRYNPENLTSHNIVPGLLGVILTMTLVMMTAMAVTREVERGTMESLLATPATPLEIMVGKLLPYILVGITQTTVVLIVAGIVFGVPMPHLFSGWLALAVGLSLFILGNLSLGYLISTVAQSQLQAMQMSVFVLMPSILLSGFAFPFYGMPGWAQALGNIIPNTHFLRIVRGTLLKEATLSDLSSSIMALSLFVLVISILAVTRSRTTLD